MQLNHELIVRKKPAVSALMHSVVAVIEWRHLKGMPFCELEARKLDFLLEWMQPVSFV